MNITYADWSSPTTISVYPEARSGYFGVVGTFPNTLRENTNVMRGNIPLVGGSFGDSYGTAPAVSEVADEVSDITGEVLGVAEVKGRVATELSEITDGGSDITDVVSGVAGVVEGVAPDVREVAGESWRLEISKKKKIDFFLPCFRRNIDIEKTIHSLLPKFFNHHIQHDGFICFFP